MDAEAAGSEYDADVLARRRAEQLSHEESGMDEVLERVSRMDMLDDQVLVRVISMRMTGTGMLHLPDTATEKSLDGEVVAVGPGKWHPDGGIFRRGHRAPMPVEVGDRVVFGKWSGSNAPDVDEFMVFRPTEFVCILRDSPVRTVEP